MCLRSVPNCVAALREVDRQERRVLHAPTARRTRFSDRRPRGMTFVELLAVSAILLMLAGAMAAVAINVQDSGKYNFQQSMSLQHGLVALQRVQRSIGGATANAAFPGFLVFADTVAGRRYPDTLVVWHAPGGAANPAGLPKMNELVVFCPNPALPNELWEITAPNDTRDAPDPSDLLAWSAELEYFKQTGSVRRVVLTNLLRVVAVDPNVGSLAEPRGMIRFESRLRPSADEWAEFVAGTRAWDDLPWVQGIHGTDTGLRQTWCRYELQLRPGDTTDDRREMAIPFFGSGSVIHELHKP